MGGATSLVGTDGKVYYTETDGYIDDEEDGGRAYIIHRPYDLRVWNFNGVGCFPCSGIPEIYAPMD